MPESQQPADVGFRSRVDGSEQRYVLLLPAGFRKDAERDLLVAFHGHGSDRWQFVRDPRDECRAARDVAAQHGMIYVSPDYRAPTSWMGPAAEQDTLQILGDIKRQYRIGRVILVGGSMGGTAVLIFTGLHPAWVNGVCSLNGTANMEEFANFSDAVAASYGGTRAEVPAEYRRRSPELVPERFTMPVSFTAGGQDASVPPHSVRRLEEKIRPHNPRTLMLFREQGGHETNYADTCQALEFVVARSG